MDHFIFLEADRALNTVIQGEYNYLLVILSILVAITATYTSFLLSERIKTCDQKKFCNIWLVAGAISLGSGIWSMHFIGMLAFRLPVTVQYDVLTTMISVIPALLASLIVLKANTAKTSALKLILRSVLMGGGIGLMHYIGMSAMHMDAAIMRYAPGLFSLSIVVAVVLAMISLRIKEWAEEEGNHSLSQNQSIIVASIMMGIAISGMHYTGMAAVSYFPEMADHSIATSPFEPYVMAMFIALVMSGLLILLITAVFINRRLTLVNKLQASEIRLTALFDSVADGIITIDERGSIESFNPAAEEIFGYAANEVIGQRINMLMPESIQVHHDAYMNNYHETGQKKIIGIGREETGKRKDGSTFPINLAISEATVEGKKIFIGSIRDITEHKKIEQALEIQRYQIEAVNQAQTMFIHSADPVVLFNAILPDIIALTGSEYGLIGEVLVDEKGDQYLKSYAATNISWNDETRQLYEQYKDTGIEFHDLDNLFGKVIIGEEIVISNSPKDDPRSKGIPKGHPPLNAYLGIPVKFGGRLLGMIGLANRNDGYDETIVELLQPVISTCGQLLDALKSKRREKQVAAQLKQMKDFVDQTLDTMTSGICVLNENAEIMYINKGWKKLGRNIGVHIAFTGLGVNYIDSCNQFRNDSDAQQIAKLLTTLYDGSKKSLEIEYDCTGYEDHYWFRLSAQNFYIEDKLRVVLSLEDVTQLRQAVEDAHQATKAKSNFLATMSHEIRTPMNGVLGMLHLLKRTQLDSKQKRYLETASGSGEMLLAVINDILDFSKMDADKLELESIPFSPLDIVEETVILLAKTAHDKGLEMISLVDSAVPHMMKGDPTRLRQILLNLTNNAIKFTESGQISVYVFYYEDKIRFSVLDTGIGISREQQKLLFESFSQVDSSHTRKYGGTGLGLVISKRLVNAMGGDLKVISNVGVGTEFSFTLVLDVVDEIDPKEMSTRLAAQRILVVDDNAVNRTVVEQILESWNVSHVDSAEDALEGLSAIKAANENGQPYDFALLDMQMPDVDGHELAKMIRNDKNISDIKLIMLSSVDLQPATPELDAWLTKPVRQSDLYNTLMMSLGNTIRKHEHDIVIENLSFHGRKLLLVEDNEINQQVANEIFSEAGFEIDIRDNGEKALNAVQEKDYDVVLMDIQMSVMDGLEAATKIRSLGGKFTSLPIIAMTAHALTGDSDKSLDAGMNAHITKPIDPDHVLKIISDWIKPDSDSIKNKKPAANKDIGSVADFPELAGINVEDGLNRMRGNSAAYKRILINFLNKQSNSCESIDKHLKKSEWDEATNIAHSLKGSGGNIGAEQLHIDAAALEQACRAEDLVEANSLLTKLTLTLTEIIEGLTLLNNIENNESDAKGSAGAIDNNMLSESMSELIPLLDSDIAEAQTLVEKLQQQTAGTSFENSMKELTNSLNSFDVESAKDVANTIRTECVVN